MARLLQAFIRAPTQRRSIDGRPSRPTAGSARSGKETRNGRNKSRDAKISEQLLFCCVAVAGKRQEKRGGEGVSEARGSVSVCSCVLGRCCCIWGCCGLGVHCRDGLVAHCRDWDRLVAHCRDGLVAGTEVVVGGEGVGSVFSVRAAERTSAAGLLWVSQSGAYLRKTGVGGCA